MLQFGASLTYDTSSINYNHNMFIIQASEVEGSNPAAARHLEKMGEKMFLNSRKQKLQY